MKTEMTLEGFNEISQSEQKEINGGIWPLVASLIVAAVTEVLSDWDNFKNGLKGLPEQ